LIECLFASGLGGAEQLFQFGPGLFYRIQVRRVRRLVKQACSSRSNKTPQVAATKVHELAQGGYIERAEPIVLIGDCDPVSFCTTWPHH
jgi:hypothetical protein